MAIVHQCHCGVKLYQSTKELAYCGNNLLEQETVVILMPRTAVTNVMALFFFFFVCACLKQCCIKVWIVGQNFIAKAYPSIVMFNCAFLLEVSSNLGCFKCRWCC